MEDARIQQLLDMFVAFGEVYQTSNSDPTWRIYPEALSDRVQSLAVFPEGYAFERAGRAPRYSGTAARIVKQKRPQNLDPNLIWHEFSDEWR